VYPDGIHEAIAEPLRKAGGMKRGFPGKPVIVVTLDRLEWRSGYVLIPASLLLWALG
jgi:hypothetical protein